MIYDLDKLKKDLVRIEDITRFKVDIPSLHPDNPQYSQLWKHYFKLCIEGLWEFDNGGYRFMPPALFFYVNFCKIEHTERGQKIRRYIKPFVRDLDWMIHYAYLEAQGFSGFKKDELYSCDKALIDPTLFSEIETSEKQEDKTRYLLLHQPDGKRKLYTPVREYIQKLHDKPLGCPIYYNPAQNLLIFGSRGGGKSFTVAGINTHILTFDGAKEYTKAWIEKPTVAAVSIGAGITDKSSELVSKVVTMLNRLGTDNDLGVYGTPESKVFEPNPFYRSWVGDSKPGNKKNPFRYEYEVETPQGWVTQGTGTRMFHQNYSDKKQDGAQAGAGARVLAATYEEIGLMPNFISALLSDRATVSVDGEQFGVQIGLGTSGNIDLVQQSRMAFENPAEYNFLEYENVWETADKKIGLFIPAYLTELRFKDKNGNTNLEHALKHFQERRLEAASKSDPASIYNEKMNYPLVPSDMWISNKGNYFPQIELMEREKELIRDQYYKTIGQPTKLIWDSKQLNGIRAEYDPEIELIQNFPYKNSVTKLDGGVCIYEKPQSIKGEIPRDMYIAVFDPYVSENIDEGGSLGVTKVFLNPKYTSQGFNGNYLVATYIGKHPNGKDSYYEIQEKLLAYYGNPIRGLWYEANRGDSVRGYYTRKNKLYLLALRPNKERGSNVFQQKVLEYGFNVGNQVDKIQMVDDTAEWLLQHTVFNGKKMRVVETYPCLFTVQQLIQFELKGNYDAVSALLGFPLALKELEHTILNEKKKSGMNPLAAISMSPNLFKDSNTLHRIKQLNEKIRNETREQ